MKTKQFCIFLQMTGLALLIFAVGMTSIVNAGYTVYSGSVGDWGYGQAIENGFVIAGTFEPGFDVSRYKFIYGMDDVGNMDSTGYSQAIVDGVFRPLGNGTHTVPNGTDDDYIYPHGYFSGFAATSDPDHYGSKIYLFCFNDETQGNVLFAIFTSTNPSWVLGSENRTLYASDADRFVFGSKGYGDFDIELQGLPMPEPSTIVILSSGLLTLCFVAKRSRRRRKDVPY